MMPDREKEGRGASPASVIVDTRSAKCDAPRGKPGYGAGKKVSGRGRHPAADCKERLPAAWITKADVPDRTGGIALMRGLVKLCPWIKKVVADGGYKKIFLKAVRGMGNRVAELVKRPEFAKSFHLPSKRWRVERTISVSTISRRLKMDHENVPHLSAVFIFFSSITWLLASVTMK